MADRKITDLTALAAGSQATGDLLTIVDVSESAAADKNKKITVESLFKGIPGDVGIGTSSPAGNLQISGTGDRSLLITGGTSGTTSLQMGDSDDADIGAILYDNSNNSMQFKTNASEQLRINSSGNIGIGTSSPTGYIHIEGTSTGTETYGRFTTGSANGDQSLVIKSGSNRDHMAIQVSTNAGANDDLALQPDGGNVGIGVINPGDFNAKAETLVLANGGDDVGITLDCDTDKEGSIYFADGSSGDNLARGQIVYNHDGDSLRFVTNASERMRLIGTNMLISQTSSINVGSSADARLQVGHGSGAVTAAFYCTANTAQGGTLVLGSNRGSTTTSVQDDDTLGDIRFAGSDGTDMATQGATISASVDGTPGSNDMPGRLVFSTTANGESTPQERMRITNNGDIRLAMANFDNSSVDGNSVNDGIVIDKGGGIKLQIARSSGTPLAVNRIGNDGNLVNLRQGGVQEGAISVSGTTVTYGGGHLARWSQLAGGAERIEILRGSVLSNLDEMCEWGEEDNEQLNRMKVSDAEGDANVSGVFVRWDDDDDTYSNDFYCAMTGDFVIRIAQGTTVARGDLLMSAGDGTAKPQDDDIVRSKTIAKVTSTTVSTTYADGSYCVPCVLMAC